jgi:hypothetical protein
MSTVFLLHLLPGLFSSPFKILQFFTTSKSNLPTGLAVGSRRGIRPAVWYRLY